MKDHSNILDLAHLANESYFKSTFNVGECETLVEEGSTTINIAVAGTEFFSVESLFKDKGILDVWRDARVAPWYNSVVGWGHAGFMKGAIKIVKELERGNYLDKGKLIRLTGHSMGAAIASFVALFLKDKGYAVALVRFGCPGLHLSSVKYNFPSVCFKNGGDYVYGMPTYLPYRHIITPFPIGQDKKRTSKDHPMGLYLDNLEIHYSNTSFPR